MACCGKCYNDRISQSSLKGNPVKSLRTDAPTCGNHPKEGIYCLPTRHCFKVDSPGLIWPNGTGYKPVW